MAKKTTKKTTKKATKKATAPKKKIGFPQVKPPSLEKRNQPHSPITLQVCGNPVPVNDGIAAEADPKVLRRRAKAAAKRRGGDIDEIRI